ncbi:CoA transferase [Seongchinamella unica]|uniref:CoA transferase n=1 Tax=Seongchinamella unica TaxID=2547392 RepID=A0A4R5LMR8_9GAMM|nr:CoA transferase [Seongchinamella unica]TDG11309.1 CoA transferase [Seongchinamella unica]
MTSPLAGIRILDLSRGVAGPMASMVLATNGAQVIKIDPPGGDEFASQLGYRAWQRGKRNAVFDLKNAEDRIAFLDLVKTADVLLESYKPGVASQLGIDYEAVSAVNPRLIYCSITGYGRNNPLSDRPGYDALVAARVGMHYEQRGRLGGVAAASGGNIPFEDFEFNPEGVVGPRHEDRDGPLFTGICWPSVGAGYAALSGISAALLVRETTGRGQWVETSLLQGALSAGGMAYCRADKPDAPHYATWINDSRSPKGNFECADGRWIINWVPNPSFILGASEGDELNPTPDMSARQDPDRIMPAMEDMFVLDHYYPLMVEAFKRYSADEWVEAGALAGQCIQKVRSPEESLNDPLFLADGCVVEVEDPALGVTRQAGVLYRLEKNPCSIPSGIATSGEHTEEVKTEAAGASSSTVEAGDAAAPEHPLSGVKVVDLGLAIAGPFGAQVLSDLGATVIKVNATYDWFWHSNAIAMGANRGKRSIAVNMRDSAGVEVIQKLVADADVVIHNMRYKAVEGKGLDYETLKKINPRLIYCHSRGFENGPRQALPGNDQTGSALTGVEWEDGGCSRGGRPYWSLTTLGDMGNGYLAATAIMQALRLRERTGEGQFVDTSIVNAHLFNCSHVIAPAGEGSFDRPHLAGDGLGYSAGYRLYKTADGYLCLVLHTQKHWHDLFAAIECPEMMQDSRFTDPEVRAVNDRQLNSLLESIFATKTAGEWHVLLDAARVPCEIANTDFRKEMWSEGSFMMERNWLVNLPHRIVGHAGHVGLAHDLSETPAVIQGGPLIVGEQTREILTELGYSQDQQEQMLADQVVSDESCYMFDIGDKLTGCED